MADAVGILAEFNMALDFRVPESPPSQLTSAPLLRVASRFTLTWHLLVLSNKPISVRVIYVDNQGYHKKSPFFAAPSGTTSSYFLDL